MHQLMQAALDDKYRQQMQRRLGRATRRFIKLEPLLSKGVESDPIAALKETEDVEGDFAHIISEMKNVRHDFGAWCESGGNAKSGNRRMDEWASSNLNEQQANTWRLIREVRDCDVHREPIVPARKPHYLMLGVGNAGILPLMILPYVVNLQLNDGSSQALQVLPFCKESLLILQKFVCAFHLL